jgi:hypothetical protein
MSTVNAMSAISTTVLQIVHRAIAAIWSADQWIVVIVTSIVKTDNVIVNLDNCFRRGGNVNG